MKAIIIGSGPGAVGAALALTEARHEVTIVDLGGRLQPDNETVRQRLAAQQPAQWTDRDVSVISEQPVAIDKGTLPQKRSYGSTYPFDDLGQLADLAVAPGGNQSVVSSAYGGFSNVWGAQIMPFSRATFRQWPIGWDEIEPHYRAVLREVPLAAEDDDYSELFPLLTEPRSLPPLAPRTGEVLNRYARHRAALRDQGITVGHARLAFQAKDCAVCGLCMTGCPYGLIYSAAQTVDRLRSAGSITYREELLVLRVAQDGDRASVLARDRSGREHRFEADRVFVGAGAMGSTRILLSSLENPPPTVTMGESIQIALPFLSLRPVQDPRERQDWTLNQFNILVDPDRDGYEPSQFHCYPYNPAFLAALPAPLRLRVAEPATAQLLRRITVGLGYLPSWRSPRVRVTHRPVPGGGLRHLTIDGDDALDDGFYRRALQRLRRAAPRLDLWPVGPMAALSGAAKTYHFGGSFAHAHEPDDAQSDVLGRHRSMDRVHLIDGAVFPTVPSTTFTLTVMANAHRIATAATELEHRP